MMVELIVTSGALVGDLLQRYHGDGGACLCFEKIMPGDPRGRYGEYLIWLVESEASTVMRRYSSKIRKANGPAPLNKG